MGVILTDWLVMMRSRSFSAVFISLVPLLLLIVAGTGCDLIKAKAAFKDGNKLYKAEDYRGAIEEYEQAVAHKPDFAEAHAYLASAHQALFLPGREEAENRMHAQRAILASLIK